MEWDHISKGKKKKPAKASDDWITDVMWISDSEEEEEPEEDSSLEEELEDDSNSTDE